MVACNVTRIQGVQGYGPGTNTKTAKAPRIATPQVLLFQAEHVIAQGQTHPEWRPGRPLDLRLCHTLPMRIVGHTRIPGPQLTPSAQGLVAARAHQNAGLALAAVPTTGIRHGIYRFASHEEMNRATEEALVGAICLNVRAREAVSDPEHER